MKASLFFCWLPLSACCRAGFSGGMTPSLEVEERGKAAMTDSRIPLRRDEGSNGEISGKGQGKRSGTAPLPLQFHPFDRAKPRL
jgi:hypothetical protein